MVKRIQVSSDDVTYFTLPGNSGELSNEAGQLPDTIFGQDFQSNFPGLIGWQIQANGIFKGFAGYEACIKITGSALAFTTEAAAQVGATLTYQMVDTTKRIFDRATPVVVWDNGAPVAAVDIESIDFLFGRVTFIGGYTVLGAVTFNSGSYLPTTLVGGSRSFTLTQTANAIDETTMPDARSNDGHRLFDYGLKTVSLDMTGVYAISNGFLQSLKDRDEVIIEINPDGAELAMCRGYFRFTTQAQSGDVGELEEETVSLTLSVPDEETLEFPFAWQFEAASTLSQSLQDAINAWQNSTVLYARYLPDNNIGVDGQTIVTDISLAGGLETMNDFTVNMQGTGVLAAFP